MTGFDDRVFTAVFPPPRTVAVIGISADPGRPSHQVARHLKREGYTVVGINPALRELWQERVFPSLAVANMGFDIVVVFRRSERVADHADDILAAQPRVLWLQDGVRDDRLAARAEAAGILVVQDDCIARRCAAWRAATSR